MDIYRSGDARKSLEESLRKLKTDYIDLLLVHQPFGDYYGTYRIMEEAYRAGKVRAIGVSNFYPDRFVDLAENVEIKPAVNQLRTNVFSQQWDAETEMVPYGTRIMAWAPLAQSSEELFSCKVLKEMAAAAWEDGLRKWPCVICYRGISLLSRKPRTAIGWRKTCKYSIFHSRKRKWRPLNRSIENKISSSHIVIRNWCVSC